MYKNYDVHVEWTALKRPLRKILKMMKLTIFLILTSVLGVLANGSYSQNTRINLDLKNSTVEQVLKEIENQSEFYFLYSKKIVDVERKVSVKIDHKLIRDVLDELFMGTPVTYAIQDRQIVLSSAELINQKQGTSSSQQNKVTGKVTDKNGSPLPGVAVVIKGTNIGTITDANGSYSISGIPAQGQLRFSFVGMKVQEVNVAGKTVVDITMEEEAVGLEEVVAIGYGATKKKDLTSSISTVNSKDFNVGSQTNVMQLLQGKVPGLNITKDGNPSGATAVILRGPSTLRTGDAQEPLYVVDGVPGGVISSMDDVVSIDILRDASATAIYGSRAANGVIIVTTKRGEENNSKISYNGYAGIETISNKIDMMSGEEYRSFLAKNNLSVAPEDEDNVNTDWLKEVTRIGISHNNNISIGGGNSKTTYFASATYKDVEGIIKETSNRNFSMMANVQQKAINDRLKVGFTLTNTLTDKKLLPSSNTDATSYQGNRDFLLNMLNYLPTVSVKDANGNYNENFNHPGAKNPVALLAQNDANNRTKSFLGSGRVQFNILEGLDWEMNASYQNTQVANNTYFGKSSSLAIGYNGLAIRNTYENEMKLFETFASFKRVFDKHDMKLMVGYSWQENKTGNGFQLAKYGFVTDELSFNNMTLGNTYDETYSKNGAPSVSTLRMISGYARLNYAFNNKYLLQATIRRDGSSAFGENNRWGTFPSASIGWRIMEEPFVKNLDIFENLKLRAGYGISGNSLGFDPLIARLRYGSSGKFYYQGNYITAIVPTQNENPDLKWERTGMLNVGLDFAVLKGRLSGTVEYYDKLTKDLIYYYAVPSTEYYVSSLTANVGEMENKGWEVSLSGIPVRTAKFQWNTTCNISFNHNNVNSLSNLEFQLDYIKTATSIGEHGQSGNFAQMIQAGHPIGQFYLWDYRGHNASGQSQFTKADGTLTTTPSSTDHFFQGNAQPKITGGWYNSMTYKNFSLDFLFRGVAGNYILDATRADLNYPAEATHYNMPKMTAKEPINDTGASYISSRYLEKGDYIRLDNVTLAYNFKLNTNQIKTLRIYSTLNNVFVITGYKGIDPEVYMGGITPGVDNGNFYPKTRTFILGVNVDF